MLKKIVLFLIVISAVIWFRHSSYLDMITFANLKANADTLKAHVNSQYVKSAVIFVIGYNIFTALALPGAVIVSICSGYVFGLAGGLVLSILSATSGACCAFLFSRYLVGGWINAKYAEQLKRFNADLEENGHLYLLTLRLIPLFPFFLVNVLAGLTNIRFRTFLWTTAIGIIPGGFVFIYAGSRLSSVNSVNDIFTGRMLSVFILFASLMLVPVIYKKIKGKR